MPPEGRAGHRAGGEETDSTGQFRVPRSGSVRRREDRERERYVEENRPERTRGEQLRGDGGPADLKKTKVQYHEHLYHTGMPVRNGDLDTDRTTTKAANVRKQLGMKIAGVTRADRRRMVELREETE